MDDNNQNQKSDSNSGMREKRSIRNIPLTKKQTKELEKIEEEMTTGELPPAPLAPPPPVTVKRTSTPRTRKDAVVKDNIKKRSTPWWIVAAVCLVIIYFLGQYFAKATVNISAAEETVVLNGTTFGLTLATTTKSNSAVVYAKSSFTLSTTTTISATGEQKIQKKATGKIVVYNDSSSSQLLIATTRFESANGLLFRLNSNITVPAKKNVTVDVTADQPGEKYNIPAGSFTLPGFKGTAKAKTIYGKSANSMTGGSVSTVAQTSSSELSAAKAILQEKLKTEIAIKAASSIPDGYVFLDGSVSTSYDTVKQTYDQSTKTATLAQNVNVAVYYLKKDSLSSAVASKSSIFAFSTTSVDAEININSITAEVDSAVSPLKLTLTGTSTVRGAFDVIDLATKVSGQTRGGALSAIKSLAGVDAAKVSIQPFWATRLPTSDDIEVVVQ